MFGTEDDTETFCKLPLLIYSFTGCALYLQYTIHRETFFYTLESMQRKLDQNNTINTFGLLPVKRNNMDKMWTIVILVT